MLQNPTHASLFGKEIYIMNLGEASKRMHAPMAYLENLFMHKHVRFHYVHENDPDDSMFRAATDFQEAMNKITDPDTKSHLYKYQKDLKIRILREREDKLEIKKNIQKEKTKKEAIEHATSSISAFVLQLQLFPKFFKILGPPFNFIFPGFVLDC